MFLLLAAVLILLYTIIHELSHLVTAILLRSPVKEMEFGPTSWPQFHLSIGSTRVSISFPLGARTIIQEHSHLKLRIIALSGSFLPFVTWSLGGMYWHVILIVSVLSLWPTLPDGALLFT